jgi:hypothetical protein
LGNFSNPLKGMGTAISSRVAKATTAVKSASPSLLSRAKGAFSSATQKASGAFSSVTEKAGSVARSVSPILSKAKESLSSVAKKAGSAVSSAGSRILSTTSASTAQGQGNTQPILQQEQMVSQSNVPVNLMSTGSDTVNMVPVSPDATFGIPQQAHYTQPIPIYTSVGQNTITQKTEAISSIRNGNKCYDVVPVSCPSK